MTGSIAKVAKGSNRGSKPGERRGGRVAGTPNRATAEVKDLAREYGAAAIERLAHLMTAATSETAQVAAAREILDRAYGKAPQAITGDPTGTPVRMIIETGVARPNREA